MFVQQVEKIKIKPWNEEQYIYTGFMTWNDCRVNVSVSHWVSRQPSATWACRAWVLPREWPWPEYELLKLFFSFSSNPLTFFVAGSVGPVWVLITWFLFSLGKQTWSTDSQRELTSELISGTDWVSVRSRSLCESSQWHHQLKHEL